MRFGRQLEIRFSRVPGVAPTAQFVLTILFVCALAALLLAHHMVWVFVPAALSLVSLFVRLERLSRWAAVAAQYASYAALGGTLVLAYIFMAYPILSQQRMSQLTLLQGLALAGFALAFLFGTEVWRPGAALVPCVLGMFVLAAFNSGARLELVLALGGAAGIAYLAVEAPGSDTRTRAPASRRIKWRTVFVILPAALIAASIIWSLPRAQTRVESATIGLMNTSTTSYSSFSSESRLGDLEQLQLSSKVVFRVWSSQPQKLRGRIFTQFDGRAWRAPASSVQQLRLFNETATLDAETVEWLQGIPGASYAPSVTENDGIPIRTRIVQAGFNPGLLISPARQALVRAETSVISADVHQTLTTPLSASVEIYGILNRRSGDLVQPGAAPPALLAETSRPPERLDPRIAELARRLAGEANSPEERIQHTVRFVQNECHYSLEVGRFRREDPVAEFLFEKKRGYCEYFASAAAVLLRQQGIPCRYVTGFVVQEWNRQGGHFVVREADAHAWIEAYVPGKGWIEADPTPEAEYAAARARFESGWFEDAKEWVSAMVAELLIYVRRGDWTGALRWLWVQIVALWGMVWTWQFGLGAALILGALAAVRFLPKSRRRATGRPAKSFGRAPSVTSREAQDLISLVDRLWVEKGLARPASRAPLEHLASLPAEKLGDEFRQACKSAVEYFYQISFGGSQPMPDRLQGLHQDLEKSVARN